VTKTDKDQQVSPVLGDAAIEQFQMLLGGSYGFKAGTLRRETQSSRILAQSVNNITKR